jgi:hypothetical protein
MKGINHLVLAADDLAKARDLYGRLGFTLCPAGQHPFGTGNTVIQMKGTYLELLAVTRPEYVVEPTTGEFSFSAFNRDYLKRHEGFSMLVLDSEDAKADRQNWQRAGITTYKPFDFSRPGVLPDGEEVMLAFAMAYTSHEKAPWLGLFTCQHFRPDYYEQDEYLHHANGAHHLHDVWVTGDGALDLEHWFTTVSGSGRITREDGRIAIATNFGTIVLAEPDVFRSSFGCAPPHPEDGPHLAAYTIACSGRFDFPKGLVETVGPRQVLMPENGLGTAVGFLVVD